ncbi:MAG: hypothetical protein V1926_02940 [Candidatus Peregrinibacteria bacterium]
MSRRLTILLLGALLFFCYAYVYQGSGWNQNSRLDLLHALVYRRTLKIDDYRRNTEDVALVNGHVYSEKAPGVAVLALPAFQFSARISEFLGKHPEKRPGWVLSSWMTTALSAGLLTAVGGMALCALLMLFVPRRNAVLSTLALFLGGPFFPYATMLFSHAITGSLIAIGLLALFLGERCQPKHDALTGLCFGFAVACEYPAALVVGGILLYAFFTHQHRLPAILLWMMPGLLLIPFYNVLVSGSPFALGYSVTGPLHPGMHEGVVGFTYPKLSAVAGLLVSEYRGLFFWTPFLILALPGLAMLSRSDRKLAALIAFTSLVYLLVIASYHYWDGGRTLGPRHLTVLVPLLAIPAAIAFREWKRLGGFLVVLSILFTGGATVISAAPWEGVDRPIGLYYLPLIRAGDLTPNLGLVLGMPGYWSLLPLVGVVLIGVALLLREKRI